MALNLSIGSMIPCSRASNAYAARRCNGFNLHDEEHDGVVAVDGMVRPALNGTEYDAEMERSTEFPHLEVQTASLFPVKFVSDRHELKRVGGRWSWC
uniref:Uncharacterized protein n=1 Tax=Nymphaea colorata TaxID=210225 RepID=A0A5K1D595_9MAGN